MTPNHKKDVLPVTRALMVPKTQDVLGRRIEQISGHLHTVNQVALHPVFPKLEQQGANSFCGGASENNLRARLTRDGRKPLQVEAHDWEQTAATIAPFFKAKAGDWT